MTLYDTAATPDLPAWALYGPPAFMPPAPAPVRFALCGLELELTLDGRVPFGPRVELRCVGGASPVCAADHNVAAGLSLWGLPGSESSEGLSVFVCPELLAELGQCAPGRPENSRRGWWSALKVRALRTGVPSEPAAPYDGPHRPGHALHPLYLALGDACDAAGFHAAAMTYLDPQRNQWLLYTLMGQYTWGCSYPGCPRAAEPLHHGCLMLSVAIEVSRTEAIYLAPYYYAEGTPGRALAQSPVTGFPDTPEQAAPGRWVGREDP